VRYRTEVAKGDFPAARCCAIWICAARLPSASRECLQAPDLVKSAHTQRHPSPDSKATLKRSIKYSLRMIM